MGSDVVEALKIDYCKLKNKMQKIIHSTISISIFLLLQNLSLADDFWKQTNGPFGGSVNSIVFDDSNYIYIATYDGGAYKSLDEGEQWNEINNGFPYDYLTALEINLGGDLFAGIDGEGIYRSSDAGGSWEFVSSDITSTHGYSLFINNGHIFAGISGGGIYRSTDNGNSWTRIKSGLEMGGYPVFAVNQQNEIYVWVSANFGIFKSIDNGDNWIELNRGYSGLFYDINDMIFDFSDNLYAATDNGVFLSNDDTDTWIEVSNGLPGYASVNNLCIDANNVFYAGCWSSGVFYSTDMGNNWIELNTGLDNNSIYVLSINENRNLFAGTSRNGVYRRRNFNDQWQQKTIGITNTYITGLASQNDSIYAGTYYGSIYLSHDKGENWKEIYKAPDNLGSINDIMVSNLGHIFISREHRGIWRSEDGGNNWIDCNNGISNTWIKCFGENSQGNIFIGTEHGGVLRSENNGDAWTLLYGSQRINSLIINHHDHIFIGTNRVYRSIDNGQTWIEKNYGFREYYEIYDFAIDSKGVILAATSGDGIYRSSNNGENWESVAYSNYWQYFTSIIIDHNDYIFASLENGGVIYSTDGGNSWAPINSGLKSNEIYALTFSSDNYIYAGTKNFGVFCSSFPSFSIMPPNSFNLGLNYPNPFNSTTTIPINANSTNEVTLSIYNILGQEIKMLFRGTLKGGTNLFKWDGTNSAGEISPSGLYIYKLNTTKNKHYAGKMILMR